MTRPRDGWGRYLTWALVIAAVLFLAFWLRLLVTTLLTSAVVAYLLEPFVDAICRVKFPAYRPPKSLCATLVVLLALLLAAVLIWLVFFPAVKQQSEYVIDQWPEIKSKLEDLGRQATSFYEQSVPGYLQGSLEDATDRLVKAVSDRFYGGLQALGRSFTLLAELFLVPILVFYFLTEIKVIKEEALFFVPDRWRPRTERALQILDFVFRRYIRAQVILCLIAFAVVTVGLWAIGIRFYLLLGLFAGITRAVPIIGPVIGGAPILIAVLLGRPFHHSLWVLGAFALMHVLESKLLMPKVLGLQLRIHPVLIVVVLLIGAEFFGLVGMFLAVPAFAAFRFLLADYRRPEAGAPPDQLALDLASGGSPPQAG